MLTTSRGSSDRRSAIRILLLATRGSGKMDERKQEIYPIFFKNCIENFTVPKAEAIDSSLEEVETVTHVPRNLPFFGASIDKSISTLNVNEVFEGIIVTTIDFEYKNGKSEYTYKDGYPVDPKTGETNDTLKESYDKITFSGSTGGGKNDGDVVKAIFVKNIVKTGSATFEGDKMSVEQAHKYFTKNHNGKTPLFFVHGFNNEPDYTLDAVKKAQASMGKDNVNVIIPVIWPCHGWAVRYHGDRYDNINQAVIELYEAFKDLKENLFKKKNLICHSMGNYLLRKVAGKLQGIKFDNIIMVAADLRHNLFDKAFIERGSEDKYKEGLYLFRLLKQENGKPVGKIYCAYNGYDRALAASTSVGGNWVTRMGTVGVGTYDHWWWGWADDANLLHPEIRGYTENFNAGKRLSYLGFSAHGYQWEKFMIDYYKSKLN